MSQVAYEGTAVESLQEPLSPMANGGDQRLAATGLATPPDSIASLLHRLVRLDRAENSAFGR